MLYTPQHHMGGVYLLLLFLKTVVIFNYSTSSSQEQKETHTLTKLDFKELSLKYDIVDLKQKIAVLENLTAKNKKKKTKKNRKFMFDT